MERGGILGWGIAPTLTKELQNEGGDENGNAEDTLVRRLEEAWDHLGRHGVDRDLLLDRAPGWPQPSCLINSDGAATVG